MSQRITFRKFTYHHPDYRFVLYGGKLVGTAIKRDGEWTAEVKTLMGFTAYRGCATLKELADKIQ